MKRRAADKDGIREQSEMSGSREQIGVIQCLVM